jgi:hypothetical protein
MCRFVTNYVFTLNKVKSFLYPMYATPRSEFHVSYIVNSMIIYFDTPDMSLEDYKFLVTSKKHRGQKR